MSDGDRFGALREKFVEFFGAAPGHIGRFFNHAFRLVLGGTAVERILKQLQPTVDAINALEPAMVKLTDTELAAKTVEFRHRLAGGETLDDLLVEAFAVVREAARRLEGTPYPKRHYDVQLVGGIVLHQGKIAEMITGEGKTLVATLPAYLNALAGKSVHVVTVNDYLARRDAAWMAPVYEFLGLSVGAIQSDMDPDERQPIYASDVVYGTNNEFGFDYLRDNMKIRVEDQVQRELHYAIIDEVDSALIDEARTPLIISGAPDQRATERYVVANRAAQRLRKGEHYEVKEKEHSVVLTEAGIQAAQKLVGVTDFYRGKNLDWPHFLDNALKAKELYRRDRQYVVREGEVLIVDEFTGRLMPGRRWSDGLHQAVEAKEGLRVQEENPTLATITFQNFFRLYDKLAGMTGTALTEAEEFAKIYNLEVVPIPPNRPLRRMSHPDVIYATDAEKVDAIIEEIVETHEVGRPALVGTVSVERSEMLSERLKRRGVKHVVLNAKYHKKESAIVAQAGELGAVTIATNMAGRGTDIVLGGNPSLELQAELETQWKKPEHEARDLINVFRNARRFTEEPPPDTVHLRLPGLSRGETAPWDPALPPGENIHRIAARMHIDLTPDDADTLLARFRELEEAADAGHRKVVELGGLHIVGTERHEARRIDNQLRGRAGRQGDPGSSRFFLSLEDDLMRIFMGEWVRRFMHRAGLRDGQAIEAGMVSRAIERAQKKVEQQNFGIRKHLLEYDEVMDEQRKLVYGERQAVLEAFREREPDDVAAELLAEFVRPEWLDADAVELRRSFQPARAAAAAACGVEPTEDDWRRLPFHEFCERAAAQAPTHPPGADEIAAAAHRAAAEALGTFDDPARWAPDRAGERAEALGFRLDAAWPEHFTEGLVAKLCEAVEPAALDVLVRDWVRRGLAADRPMLPAEQWDYEAYRRWIGDLPCAISGTEWAPLLGRPEKIEPLVTRRLADGFAGSAEASGPAPAREVIERLVRASVGLYLGSDLFRSHPSPERLSFWAEYRFGVRIEPGEVRELAETATGRVADAAAEAKAEQIEGPEGVTLYWYFPAVAAGVRKTLSAEGRDFAALARRLDEDFGVVVDPFDLSKLGGTALREQVGELMARSGRPIISGAGLDNIVARTYQSVVDKIVDEYVEAEAVPAERSYAPLQAWAEGLGLRASREAWAALSREELAVLLSGQVRELSDEEARGFVERCVTASVEHFLAGEPFAEDPSYPHLMAWSRGRFSFASSPVKLETAVPRAVDGRRNEAKQELVEQIGKELAAEGMEPGEQAELLVSAALQAYFMTHAATEAIDLEPLARWVNSKLHVSAPAAKMGEMMDIDERTVTDFVCERAERSLGRQKPERVVADAVGAAVDCFLPPETFPDTWAAAELEEWLKKTNLGSAFDVYELMEDVHAQMLDVFVEAVVAGYGERPAGAVAADAARHAFATFLDSDLGAADRNFASLAEKMDRKFNTTTDPFDLSKLDVPALRRRVEREANEALDARIRQLGRRAFHWVARVLILQAIDSRWKDHLAVMDSLQSGIGMRAYAQTDPKIAYKKEGYEAFEAMIDAIQEEVSDLLLKVEVELGTEVQEEQSGMELVHSSVSAYEQGQEQAVAGSQRSEGGPQPVRATKEPGRNDPCPCGSGKKYKHCCMGKT
jgi:preprotein translocase subunit SecA